MEKKQTAVDWLLHEIKHIIPNDFLIKFEQAKQMEKEQIEEAHGKRRQHVGFNENGDFEISDITSEYYYEKTYGYANDK